jgi:hypothetical protein
MERVGLKDLFEFLQTHNIRLPRSRRDRILEDILERTDGHYEQTVGELRQWVNRALDHPEEQVAADGDDGDYDY